ncbi:hypothetical protein [Amycolatopsis tucumanensis]|nr:hypothetical protein [Amycolatopsis tucumanensis]MCF6423976.1 hypothetical protein [Amycolatopsis tucumanensis]
MTMMLADAADERLVPVNPSSLGEQVVAIAAQASALVGLWAGLLIITAAWTGARWDELTGLQRRRTPTSTTVRSSSTRRSVCCTRLTGQLEPVPAVQRGRQPYATAPISPQPARPRTGSRALRAGSGQLAKERPRRSR